MTKQEDINEGSVETKVCDKCGLEKPIKPDFKKKNSKTCKECEDNTLIHTFKIQLYPTKQQEKNMFRIGGACRFIYNWCIDRQNEHYETVKDKEGKKKKIITDYDIAKLITQLKKEKGFEWLSLVPKSALDGAGADCCTALDRYLEGISDKPTYKRKFKSKPSFVNRFDNTSKSKVGETHIHIDKVGKVRYRGQVPPNLKKYKNGRIKYDGLNWWATMSIEIDANPVSEDGYSIDCIGVDLGVRTLAFLSTNEKIKGVNKTKEVKRLEKKLIRLKRKSSRKYEDLKKGDRYEKGYKPKKTKNQIKVEDEIRQVSRKLARIRNNYRHNLTSKIVKMNPEKVVIEDLDVKGMMKNRHQAKDVANQGFNIIANQIEYKCKKHKIKLVKANRWFPSSKMCSNCGNINKNLKLSDRIYKCDVCGLIIDRDYNASINLVNYNKK